MVTKFCTPTPGCYTGKMFVNVLKIRTNSFLIPQPDISKIICDLPKWAQESEWMLYEHLMLYNMSVYAPIYVLV